MRPASGEIGPDSGGGDQQFLPAHKAKMAVGIALVLDPWLAFLRALWLFLPCYMANMTPVAAARIFPAWSAPLDGGRNAADGRRLLGGNKTWRGIVSGCAVAATTATMLAW